MKKVTIDAYRLELFLRVDKFREHVHSIFFTDNQLLDYTVMSFPMMVTHLTGTLWGMENKIEKASS